MLCMLFFKQKTAYEMRISDWSSDVCSSDLGGGRAGRLGLLHLRESADQLLFHGRLVDPGDRPERRGTAKRPTDDTRVLRSCRNADEIGRESVRERVGQYV